jgi:hypothetical protein
MQAQVCKPLLNSHSATSKEFATLLATITCVFTTAHAA